jgi:hypothetical protein
MTGGAVRCERGLTDHHDRHDGGKHGDERSGHDDERRVHDPGQGAAYIGFTAEFLKARRQRGDGPQYIASGTRAVRYRADFDAWMATQFRTSTADDGVRRTG